MLNASKAYQPTYDLPLASFQAWAPKVYDYYCERLNSLWEHMPTLRRNFPRSVFPALAFNLGPAVWTYRHRDFLNCPFGWCSVQALGRFDPAKGGHLILWDLELYVEFPPGALILLPSATISHSNVPVQDGDLRMSFVQYCPGGLFRYVDYGFRTEEFKVKDPAGYERMCLAKSSRWEAGLELFSNIEDFRRPEV